MERRARDDGPHDPAEDRAIRLLRQIEATRTDEPRPAEPMERLVARLIDFVIEAVVIAVPGFIAGISLALAGHSGSVAPRAPADATRDVVGTIVALVSLVAFASYESGLLG